jgi:hypothetical protein
MRKPKYIGWLTIVLPKLVSDIAEDLREIVQYCRDEDIRRQLAPQAKKPVTVQATGQAIASSYVIGQKTLTRWTQTYGETVFCSVGEGQLIRFQVHGRLEGPIYLSCHGGIITEIQVGNSSYLLGSCVSATIDGPIDTSEIFQVSVRAL